MKNLTWFILIGVLFAGCGKQSLEDRAATDRIDARITTIEEGFTSGKLTAAEFKEGLTGIKDDFNSMKADSIKDTLLAGGLGGLGARTALHALKFGAGFMPGIWGQLLSSALALLLGGSHGGRKETA